MEEALPFITSFGRNKDSKRIQNLGKSAKAVGLGSTSRPYVVRRLRPAEASCGGGSFSEGDSGNCTRSGPALHRSVGPHGIHTSSIVKRSASRSPKAAFFELGKRGERNREIGAVHKIYFAQRRFVYIARGYMIDETERIPRLQNVFRVFHLEFFHCRVGKRSE